MSDREEREEHIKRLEAALACEEKQSSGKCSKQTCDENCALLYEQGNWGKWKETLRYAINSLKIDLKYDLLYEETSEQADKPTTKNDLGVDAISRQEAIDTIRQLYLDLASQKAVIDIIKALPSVTPQEPKTGHWIDREVYDADRWKCSECGRTEQYQENFCPNCGAKMI